MQGARSLCKPASVSWKYDPRMWILGRYGHTETVCYKKQADEASSNADKDKSKNSFPKTTLKKEVESETKGKKKPIMFVRETEIQKNE